MGLNKSNKIQNGKKGPILYYKRSITLNDLRVFTKYLMKTFSVNHVKIYVPVIALAGSTQRRGRCSTTRSQP